MAGRMMSQEEIVNLGRYLQQGPSQGKISSSGLLGKGEGKRLPGIGALATILNTLDQPHSAIVGGLRESFKTKNFMDPTAGFKGFWKGLKGDEHTNYADLLNDMGIHNKWITAPVGFAADVALDPMTYIGVGRSGAGGIAKGTAELLAGKELGTHAVEQAAIRAADIEELKAGIQEGGLIGQAGEQQLTQIPKISKSDLAERTAQIMAEHPSKWEFRYGLPTATPRVLSVKEPERVTNLLQSITGPEGPPRKLVQAFSRRAEQPHGLAEMQRVIQGAGTADFDDQYGVWRRIFSKISGDDRQYAMLRLEKPEKYGNKPLEVISGGRFDRTPALSKLGYNTIDDIVDEVRSIHRKVLDAELSQGQHLHLLPTETKKVMHDGIPYLETERIDWNNIANQRMKDDILDKGMAGLKLKRIVRKPEVLDKMPGLSMSLSPEDRYMNLSKLDIEAIPKDAEPIIDIGESTLERLRDTYKMQTNAEFVRQAIKKFGINAREVEGASEVMRNLEAADVDKKLRFKAVQPEKGHTLLHNDVARLREFKDTYIPHDIAEVLNATHKTLTDETIGKQLLGQYDKYMGHWKAFNSLVNPGYLTRTGLGDFVQNAVAGVWDPRRYTQSWNVLKEARENRVKDVIEGLRNPDLPLNALKDTRVSQYTVPIGGADMPADRIYDYFHTTGAKSGELVSESLPNTIVPGLEKDVNPASKMARALKGGKEQSVGGLTRFEAKMADLNVGRETGLRMANYINFMDHHVTQSLVDEAKSLHMGTKDLGAIRERLGPKRIAEIEQTAAEEASKHVRKYNIDYGMLSSFEKDVMRRVVPFYSWFRLNAPQQLAQLASHPGVMTMTPKLINSAQELLGTESPEGDFMLPDWIRESMPFRLAMGGEEAHNPIQWAARKLSGVPGNNAVFMPTLAGISPMQDVETVLGPVSKAFDVMQMRGGPTNWHNWAPAAWAGAGEAAKNAANMAAPPIKGTYELGMGKSAYTGQDITNFNDWALSQLGGPGREISRFTGISNQPVISGLSSVLLGPSIQPVTQARQKGEFRRREDVLNPEIQRMKGALAKKYHVPKESKAYEKLNSVPIAQLKRYMKYGGRAVGSR